MTLITDMESNIDMSSMYIDKEKSSRRITVREKETIDLSKSINLNKISIGNEQKHIDNSNSNRIKETQEKKF